MKLLKLFRVSPAIVALLSLGLLSATPAHAGTGGGCRAKSQYGLPYANAAYSSCISESSFNWIPHSARQLVVCDVVR